MTEEPHWRIRRTAAGFVELRDEDFLGREWRRQFWVPQEGGVIRESNDGRWGYDHEVCELLAHGGRPLQATQSTLLDVIRREYRRAVAQERRQGVLDYKGTLPTGP
jgi:hypothetical protein